MQNEVILAYRGRQVRRNDIAFIRQLIVSQPQASRRTLSKMLCDSWNWVQPNGMRRDMVCRSLMLLLHRAGHIELPPVRHKPHNPLAQRRKPAPIEVDRDQLCMSLRELGPLELRQVRRTDDESLLNSLIEMHHYLGYTQPVGEHLKHVVYAGKRPIACFTWSSAPRHLGPRDRYIGWSADARKRNIRFIAYNSRFLILPWVKVPHLASHLLGHLTRVLSSEWERVYGHPIYFVETFVHRQKYRGTCYLAANWTYLGKTTGRGKDDLTHRANRPIKDVLGYPLARRFRKLLLEV